MLNFNGKVKNLTVNFDLCIKIVIFLYTILNMKFYLMIFKRKKYLNQIYNWLENNKLILILWARQVGKTTLMKMIIEDNNTLPKYYVNFDDFFDKDFLTKQEFIDVLAFTKWIDFYKEWILLLDEIQNLKNAEKILKSLYDDEKIKLKIIASWSGLFHFSNTFSTLVGRVKEIYVYPFSFYEYLEYKGVDINFLVFERYKSFMFDAIKQYLEEFYIFWGYPAVVVENTKQGKIEKLSQIIEVYLKRDLAIFLSQDEIRLFKKLLVYLANNVCERLNVSNLSSYLGISRLKSEKYIEILKNSFLLYEVFPFYMNKRKEQSRQPEIFLLDNWFLNYFSNNFDFIDFEWKKVEHFVFLELLKNKKFTYDEIKFYQKINGSEIDFIYEYKEWGILPIEVKLNDKDNLPKIFKSFYNDYETMIRYFIRTSKTVLEERKLENKIVKIVPFWMIWKSI